jgi:transketolase
MGRIDDLSIKTLMMLAADMVQKANSGHPGMPMGDACMAYVLWQKFLKHNPKNPAWQNRDRFVLSAGHGSALLYSLLHMTGYDMSMDDLKDFRQLGSKTPGHTEYEPEYGVETTTGPLGQGFATGVGMAMAEKYLAKMFNKPGHKIVDYNIYGIVSDGDLMEGISSESASLAGHLGLGKIVYLYSDNKISIEGSTDITFTENVKKRFDAYGWHTQKVYGYDQVGIARAIRSARSHRKQPSLILVRTHIGYGSPHKQDTAGAHGAPLGPEELKLTKQVLGVPNRSFYVPAEAKRNLRKAVAEGARLEREWKERFRRYKREHRDRARLWEEMAAGRLPKGWDIGLPRFRPEAGKIATRAASGKFLNAVAESLPHLIGGSADLAPSNNTEIKGLPFFSKGKAGRNIHFGVREHAMGAAVNGMALSGMLIPYCGTFLIFTDYMRPASRLSALMGTHCIYVMTHDSIGLGEDGPTHQPIEHLASYRAMPNMTVIRPADANETVEAWKAALRHKGGPVMLSLSRQGLPVIDRQVYALATGVRKGGYVLTRNSGKPDVILISSGSEVSLCLEAAEKLAARGVKARVVSMASMELFEAQDEKYKREVLPPSVTKRIAVEAGATYGWERYVGLGGRVMGIDRFGASAPAGELYEHFGLTVGNIVKEAAAMARRRG